MQAISNQKSNSGNADPSRRQREGALQLETWLPYRLFLISTRVADVLGAFYGPKFGLSRSSWRVMAIVANRPGTSAKEICQAGGLDQFSVSRAIKQLVELGFAQRQAGRSDRRYAAIELSENGWDAFREISDLAQRLDGELIGSISKEDMDRLGDILAKLDNASAGILARGWHGLKEAEGGGKRLPDEPTGTP
ncbi:MarR family transcriptional regulator [Stappia taiwanensis]|uniref:MarR family transcriptional regulator n=1 Tax=Stappia taiwanensis TaxID=992267 RepID=A0A838Y057_9HYPH|nr:MarR family transcriptional regulator [Stappia taiwanensis]MBA4612443.1 MarR family transcriptional regulator [Stappia taiwanensis]GGF05439.1 MarR family transcriptional regulator [Stappia taiwanensis]